MADKDFAGYQRTGKVINLPDRMGNNEPPGPPIGLPSNGGDGNMDVRIKRLEDDVKEIRTENRSILAGVNDLKVSMASISAKVDSLPSSIEFGYLKGRVDSLPILAKIASLFAIAVAAIVILNNWTNIVSKLSLQ